MSNSAQDAVWESLCIWKNPQISEDEIIHREFPQRVVDWSKTFPSMFAQLFNVMPFAQIWKITIATNVRRVPAHVDRPNMTSGQTSSAYETLHPWPNCVRVMLYDENIQPTFYVTPWSEDLLRQGKINDIAKVDAWVSLADPPNEKKCYVNLPKGTNAFVFSNGEFMHGADFHNKEKIILLIWGIPDTEPWKRKLRSVLQAFPSYKNECKIPGY